MENEVGSSSNIISSTQDTNYQHPIHLRYQSGEHSNTSYNECSNPPQNQFYETSLPLMTSSTSSSTPSTATVPQPIRTLRPHSTPATLIWLEDNYELAEGVCIPRSVLYMHYVDFCANNNVQPVNAASFGKIIRQQFPQLTTRRLGTRGQSRYHYYGIAIRESSAYYQSSYSKKSGQNNVDPLKREARENITKQPMPAMMNSRTRTATILPQFPNLKDVIIPSNLDRDKISTFLMMYRTHCQRILDTIIRANFDEVQTFFLHFWQGVPPHLSPILDCNSVVNLIGVCDSILYKTIANVLLPSVLQSLPESLTKMMRQFAAELDTWLRMSLFNLPETLRSVKLELARRFGQLLKRQTSLNHLSQASRMVVNNNELTVQMLRDWRLIDVHNICNEILCDYFNIGPNNSSPGSARNGSDIRTDSCSSTIKLIINFCEQFEHLLEEEAQIESYLEWLESLVHKCVLFPSLKSSHSSTIRRFSRHFLLLWSAFGSRVIRDMTLHSAQSFGSFHLLRLMFDDYVLYLVEYVQIDEQMKQFLKHIPNNEPPVFTFFYFNDCEMQSSSHQTANTSVQLEYEPTVSSSTGDFLPNDTPNNQNPNCNASDEIIISGENENDIIVTQNNNFYAYNSQNSFHSYPNQSGIYGPHIEQQNLRANPNNYSWYSLNASQMYEFEEQQSQSAIHTSNQHLCTTSSAQLSALPPHGDGMSAVNSYSVDTTIIAYNNDYERHS